MIQKEFFPLLDLVRRAGEAVLEVYGRDFAVEYKEDDSPVTAADRASSAILVGGLGHLSPGVPVVSEEDTLPPWEVRRAWDRFFLVDPLDGTKEFVKRNGEFTINVGLVEGRSPSFGVLYLPLAGTFWFGGRTWGSWKRQGDGPDAPIRVRRPAPDRGPTVLVSRSHPSPGLEEYLRTVGAGEVRPTGSALKFCLLAEGAADLYPRLAPGTWEWDTAAGQAVLEGAGGRMTGLDGEPFLYNKECLRNGSYIAST